VLSSSSYTKVHEIVQAMEQELGLMSTLAQAIEVKGL
jgi:hypothetical protein